MALMQHQGNIRTWMMAALLALMTVCAYLPAIQGGFIWDDDDYVTENQTLRSAEGFEQIWLSPKATPQYYPLVHSTFWVEYQLWGIDPLGYHLTNVILHIIAAFLLWRTLNMLGLPFAWAAAAVFALHPVNVESVAWITERKNVLSLVFYLCSTICMLRWLHLSEGDGQRQGDWKWYGGGLLFFLAALLSKTVTCSLPAALMLIVWWRRGRIDKRVVLSLLPFCLLGGVGGLSTAWLEQTHVGAEGAEWDFGLIERVLIAGRVIWFYAGKLVWPADLIFNYPRWTVDAGVWWQYLYPLSVIAMAVFLWAKRRPIGRGPLAAFLFFCGTLFPALGFIDVYPFRYSFVADHFQYHASMGLIVLIAAIAARYIEWRIFDWKPLVMVFVLFVLGLRTYYQTHDYADLETLWQQTLMKNPGSVLAHNNIGIMLFERGEQKAALTHYKEALKSNPNHSEAWNNLQSAYTRMGNPREAIEFGLKAVAVDPTNAEAHYNLGLAYATIGNEEMAIRHYRETLRLRPQFAQAHNNLGLQLMIGGDGIKAEKHFLLALRFSPRMAQAKYNLGDLYLSQKKVGKAERYFLSAAALEAEESKSHMRLGIAYNKLGKPKQAIESFKLALEHNPNDGEAHINLGVALFQQNRMIEARESFRRALAIDPQQPMPNAYLADTYLASGDTEKALDLYRRALTIEPGNLRVRLNLGTVLAQTGALEAALEHFTDASRSHPESVEAYRNLAQAQWLAGHHDAARTTYRALKLRSPQQAAVLAGFLPEMAKEPVASDGEG